MASPEVPIEVDPETGHWSTDGLPMLYVPRHFFMGVLQASEDALGRERAARHFHDVGYHAAYRWCAAEAEAHALAGMDVFHHYMRRLSQRGWGLFDGGDVDPAAGGTVYLRHSAFVAHFGPEAGRRVCYMCAGWAPGALAWVRAQTGGTQAFVGEETRCAAEGHDHCAFTVRPA